MTIETNVITHEHNHTRKSEFTYAVQEIRFVDEFDIEQSIYIRANGTADGADSWFCASNLAEIIASARPQLTSFSIVALQQYLA